MGLAFLEAPYAPEPTLLSESLADEGEAEDMVRAKNAGSKAVRPFPPKLFAACTEANTDRNGRS